MESKIEIKRNLEHNCTEIFIDGNKINGVRSFELKQAGNTPYPTLTLDLNAVNVSVDSPVICRHAGYEGMRVLVSDSFGSEHEL